VSGAACLDFGQDDGEVYWVAGECRRWIFGRGPGFLSSLFFFLAFEFCHEGFGEAGTAGGIFVFGGWG
jgi:hypothetical protein